jgi:uncharacterized membrane protein YhhN
MNPGAGWAFVAAGGFAVGDWYACARRRRPVEYVCKPGTLLMLLLAAALLEPAPGLDTMRVWFVAALACSLAGDVLLMLPSDRFVAGLSAFLVAHLCYLGGLWSSGPSAAALALAALVVAVPIVPFAHRILRSVRAADPALVAPVALYIVVISAMVATALASGSWFAGIGAVLFAGSDSLIAWSRFVGPVPWSPVAIMVTYHLGQAGLVLSLLP